MTTVKVGLIQMALKGDTSESPQAIREQMVAAHEPFIADAAAKGVQILCFQEVFTQPYFPPSQDGKWYAAAEKVPDGPTVSHMREVAKRHNMVIVVPIYEEEMTGVYYNTAAVIDADGSYLGKYRKTHIPHVSGFFEKFFFKPGASGWPVFETAYLKLGVYICYDRHFPEGWRALALHGAEYVVNPSATVTGLSRHLWELEQPLLRSPTAFSSAPSTASARKRRGTSATFTAHPTWSTRAARSSLKPAIARMSWWLPTSISNKCARFATSGSSIATADPRPTAIWSISEDRRYSAARAALFSCDSHHWLMRPPSGRSSRRSAITTAVRRPATSIPVR